MKDKGQCKNCKTAPAQTKGRCNKCHCYLTRYKTDAIIVNGKPQRKVITYRAPKKAPKVTGQNLKCIDCDRIGVSSKGRCTKCYQTWRRANTKPYDKSPPQASLEPSQPYTPEPCPTHQTRNLKCLACDAIFLTWLKGSQ